MLVNNLQQCMYANKIMEVVDFIFSSVFHNILEINDSLGSYGCAETKMGFQHFLQLELLYFQPFSQN